MNKIEKIKLKGCEVLDILDSLNHLLRWGGSPDFSVLVDERLKITPKIINKFNKKIFNLNEAFYCNKEYQFIFSKKEFDIVKKILFESYSLDNLDKDFKKKIKKIENKI